MYNNILTSGCIGLQNCLCALNSGSLKGQWFSVSNTACDLAAVNLRLPNSTAQCQKHKALGKNS